MRNQTDFFSKVPPTIQSDSRPEMDSAFCINWRGDRKTKHCRVCAVKGTPCFELWRSVQGLAEANLVLVNRKPGRAFGHRYQLEPPKKNPLICYLQTLQDKHAHFGLPIEDFLYVAKTGLAGCMKRLPAPSGSRSSG